MLKNLFIGCAGAGSNIVADLKKEFSEFDFVEYLTIDTSEANKKEGIPFVHISKDSVEGDKLGGSGGIRGANIGDVKKGVDEFINSKKLHSYDGIVYLVFSSNGGSGNIIATLLLGKLLEKDISCCCVVVHDTSSKEYAAHALNTVKSLYGTATLKKKAINCMYYVNKPEVAKTKINETICKELKLTLEFNDIKNVLDIDSQDMKNFYNASIYSYLATPPGVYGVSTIPINANAEKVLEDYDVIVARALTAGEDTLLPKAGIGQYKKGSNSKTNSEMLLLLINNFEAHYGYLDNQLKAYDTKIDHFKIDVTANNDGLVL